MTRIYHAQSTIACRLQAGRRASARLCRRAYHRQIRWNRNPVGREARLTDKFGGDEPKKLVLDEGATEREAGLVHGQVADRFGTRERGELPRIGGRRIAPEGIS